MAEQPGANGESQPQAAAQARDGCSIAFGHPPIDLGVFIGGVVAQRREERLEAELDHRLAEVLVVEPAGAHERAVRRPVEPVDRDARASRGRARCAVVVALRHGAGLRAP